jgi:peptide/nickel transport system permease protein
LSFTGIGAEATTESGLPAGDRSEGASDKIRGRSTWQLAFARLRRDRVGMISLAVIVLIILVALAAPLFATITGHGVDQQYRTTGLTPAGLPAGPNRHFLLGTDDQGRDILVRIAYGTRISLLVGVIATLLIVAIGALAGLAAGYFKGWLDIVIARLIDVTLSLPYLLFGIALVSIVGPSLEIVIAVIAFFGWAAMARIVRGQVLSIREQEYIEAARSLGATSWRIIFVDVLPNVTGQLIVYATLLIPVAIITEAGLSFLGLGVPPPTPDWGQMIAEAEPLYQQAWWFLVFPGAALVITTLAFNIFGDSVRDALDPGFDRP